MLKRCFLAIVLVLHPACLTYSQATLKQLDQLKNDSAAIIQLENYIATHALTPKEKLEVMVRISNRAGALRDFPKSIQVTNDGIVLAKKNNLDSMEAVLTKLLGITYYTMGQKETAIGYFKKAITIAQEHGHWFTESRCYSNLGAIFVEKKQ